MKKIIAIVFLLLILFISFYFGGGANKKHINASLDKLSTIKRNVSVNYPTQEEYKYLVALQLERWDIARKILTPLAKENDPNAVYWLAYISGGNVFSGSNMAEEFKKSTELGNIYGAMQLSPHGRYCDSYLKGICSEKWQQKIRAIYNKKKEKNILSLLEEYYYKVGLRARKIRLDSEVTDIVYDNANKGNYQPLLDYISYIKSNYNLNSNQKKLIKNILLVPMSNDYIPALGMAYTMGEKYGFNQEVIIKKMSTLGRYCAMCVDYYKYSLKSRKSLMKAGAYYIVKDTLKNSENIFKKINRNDLIVGIGIGSLNIMLHNMEQQSFTKKEMEEMKDNALKILNSRKTEVYITQGSYNL